MDDSGGSRGGHPSSGGGGTRDERGTLAPRSELPTLPDRPLDTVNAAAGGVATLREGALGAPDGGLPHRLSLELLPEPEEILGDDPPSDEVDCGDFGSGPATVRFDSDSLWNDLVAGPPTARMYPADGAGEAGESVPDHLGPPEAQEGGSGEEGLVQELSALDVELSDREVAASLVGLDVRALAPPPIPSDLAPASLRGSPSESLLPGELADAVDDDPTDPAVPSARRLSDRASRRSSSSPPAVAESGPPPPVSSIVPPAVLDRAEPDADELDRHSRSDVRSTIGGWVIAASVMSLGLLLVGIAVLLGRMPNGESRSNAATVRTASGPALADFDWQAAEASLHIAAAHTIPCRSSDDRNRPVTALVTFEPATGAVTRVTVTSTEYSGTTAGECIARSLRGAAVAPFVGAPITVETVVDAR
ncbi:MAG: hypothetical protein JW751_08290 [Polyangiaceae bacterium]|nr:hypothetical protein [Polyangiaceae bacterium]